MKKQTSNRIVLVNAISVGLQSGISMLLVPVYSRLLGTDNYGLVSIYTTWLSILSVIIGLRSFYAVGIASKDFPENEQLMFQATGVYIGVATSIISIVLITLLLKPLSNLLKLPEWSVLLLGFHAFGVFSIQMLNWKFTYEFKPVKNLLVSTSMSLGTALISIVLILLLPMEQRYLGKSLGTAVPPIICGISLLVFCIKKRAFFNKIHLKYMLAYTMPLVFSDLCTTLFSGSDKLMLQWMKTNSEVGIYSLAFNFAGLLFSIEYMLNHSWQPLYFQYKATGNNQELYLHMRRYIRLFSILTIGFLLLSPEVFQVFAAPEFLNGKNLIPIFSIGCYFYFMEVLAINYKSFHRESKTVAVIAVISSLANLFLNTLLIPHFGVVGASVATAIGYLLGLICNWMTLKYANMEDKTYTYELKVLFHYLIFVFIAAVLFYLPQTIIIRWTSGILLGIWLLKNILKEKQIF